MANYDPEPDRSSVDIDYEIHPAHGMLVKFIVGGAIKLTIPLKALRIAVEAGDAKLEPMLKEQQEKKKEEYQKRSLDFLKSGLKFPSNR